MAILSVMVKFQITVRLKEIFRLSLRFHVGIFANEPGMEKDQNTSKSNCDS